MGVLPRILRPAHHGVQNLVVIAASAQIPGKRLREVCAVGLPVDVDGDERFSCAAGSLARHGRGAEQIACRGNWRAAGDDPFDEVAPRDAIQWAANRLWVYDVAHLEGSSCWLPTRR